MTQELEARLQWGRKLEADLEERTEWALNLKKEVADAARASEHARQSEAEAWQCVRALEKELDETRSSKARVDSRLWTRIGRRLKML
jgi:hypothetical protein